MPSVARDVGDYRITEPLHRCGQSEVYLELLRQRQAYAYLSLNPALLGANHNEILTLVDEGTHLLFLCGLLSCSVGGTQAFPGRAG